MNNLFEQYGIKDVADVTLYAIELDENDDEVYIPVLYLDTLKVSTVEESKSTASAQGGIGNPKLITWDYGKDITVTLEDALFTPASSSMNWGAKLGAKKLQLHLRHFFDRNKDLGPPDNCLRTAILTAEQLTDFMIIPDRWPMYEEMQSSNKAAGYVGGTSIYCWMISGVISSDDDRTRVRVKDLLLFYREQTQKWYFFNGRGYIDQFEREEPTQSYMQKQYNAIGYQYGREVFDWIKENIAGNNSEEKTWTEYEPVAIATMGEWGNPSGAHYGEDVLFLTQNLYVDGYRDGCDSNKMYGDISEEEAREIDLNKYLPYRYFANIGVEYNTNVVPPQDTIFSIDTAFKEVYFVDKMEKIIANRTFCIDADINTAHGNYRYLDKYSRTPLTVFIDPMTMNPYQPNTYEYIRESGQRITGNLTVIKQGSIYYKWTRSKATKNRSLGKQLIIDAQHFPGTYRLVGETSIRNRWGYDEEYQFEIPLCKLSADNKFNLSASGEPTVFNMKLTAMRREDGVMMKLTSYSLLERQCPCDVDRRNIDQYTSPNPDLVPAPYDGDTDVDLELTINATSPRDIACEILGTDDHNNIGWKKVNKEIPTAPNEVSVQISGEITDYSIDTSIKQRRKYNGQVLQPDQYTVTVAGSEEDEHI